MPQRLPPLSSLRTFLAAATHLNFRRAAEELHVTPAAVSQQIRGLETHLGHALFHREARGLRLTAAGEALLPGIRDGFACFAAAITALPEDQAHPPLRIGAPAAFASRWLVPHLGEFSRRHPDIALHLESAPTYIDGGPTPQNALPEGVDVAIRYGLGAYPGRTSRRLPTGDYWLTCHPALYRADQPLADWLAAQTLLHDESIPVAEHRPRWAAWGERAGIAGIDRQPGLRLSNAVLVHEAVLAGQGVALMQKAHIADDLACGRLICPSEITLPSAYAYHLLLRDPAAPASRRFADWLQALCADAGNH